MGRKIQREREREGKTEREKETDREKKERESQWTASAPSMYTDGTIHFTDISF